MSNSDSYLSNQFFDAAYRSTAPWDIGEAQPDLLALLDEYPPAGRVLDVGCGTGDLAFALAQRGIAVVGVDFAEAAIEAAERKAQAAPAEVRELVTFRLGDARHPSMLGEAVGAVVDSGFLHLFNPDERVEFAQELAAFLPTCGRYYVLGFTIALPQPNGPKPVREDELRALFRAEYGWRVTAVRPARFRVQVGGGSEVPAIAACIERAAGG